MLILSWCQSVLYKQESDGRAASLLYLSATATAFVHVRPPCTFVPRVFTSLSLSLRRWKCFLRANTSHWYTHFWPVIYAPFALSAPIFFRTAGERSGESWRVNARARHRIFWGEVQGMHFALIHIGLMRYQCNDESLVRYFVFLYEGPERNSISIHTFIHYNKSGTLSLAKKRIKWVE